VQVLEGDNAVARNGEIMGATDPKKAAPGTIRADLPTASSEHRARRQPRERRARSLLLRRTDLCPRWTPVNCALGRGPSDMGELTTPKTNLLGLTKAGWRRSSPTWARSRSCPGN